MGLIKKLMSGGKSHYKVHSRCDKQEHGKVVVVTTKMEDLEEKIKERDSEILTKIFGDAYCDKCIISVDKLGEDSNVKKVKKIYSSVEL